MELKDFISQTLIAIIGGVVAAQKEAKEHGAFVNPGGLARNITNVADNSTWDNRDNNYAQAVSFDIAVTAEDEGSGGAGIKVWGIGANASLRTANSTRV